MARDHFGRGGLLGPREHGAERLEQIRAGHRFREVATNAQLATPLAITALAGGRQHQQSRPREPAIGADGGRELEPIHVRHLHIQDREIVGRVLLGGSTDCLEPLAGGRCLVDLDAFSCEHVAQDAPIRLVVVHNQHAPAAERCQPRRAGGCDFGGEGECERKLAAASNLAGDRDLAAHEPDEALRDREAEPRATVAARHGRIGLREFSEHGAEVLRCDPDARVADRESQLHHVVSGERRRDRDHDFSLLGELDGVADQVHQDLTQPRRITTHRARHLGCHFGQQLEVSFARPHGQQAGRRMHDF